MGGTVIFTGHIKFDQILAYYKTADVFLCLSEHEGFCVPIVEAMKFKVPIIAYGRAAVPETMNHKGMILDDNNPQYVAACIDKMVKDKKLRDYVIEEQNERLEYMIPWNYKSNFLHNAQSFLSINFDKYSLNIAVYIIIAIIFKSFILFFYNIIP